ncbi:YecA family protein [Thermomonas brevis]
MDSIDVSVPDLPAWAEVSAEAARRQLASSPAELHGALAGWLAAGGADTPAWLAEVLADPGLPAPADGDALDALRTATVAQLGDLDFGFQLLLPDDDTPARAAALFAWCRAFLGGFGLAVGEKKLSEEGEEALGDLANLAAARIEDVDPDGDEEALTEIEEYLRMAVLLLHADCALGPRHRQRLH